MIKESNRKTIDELTKQVEEYQTTMSETETTITYWTENYDLLTSAYNRLVLSHPEEKVEDANLVLRLLHAYCSKKDGSETMGETLESQAEVLSMTEEGDQAIEEEQEPEVETEVPPTEVVREKGPPKAKGKGAARATRKRATYKRGLTPSQHPSIYRRREWRD